MRCYRNRNAGFTFVEVMAAGVILGVLTLGLTQVWAITSERSLDATVRQKAVFVLNGQMERLAALYTQTGFGAAVAVDTTGYGSPAAYPDTRAVFRMNTNSFMDTALDAFVTDLVATFEIGGEPFVLLDDQGGSNDRNYIWIDKGRGIMGRLSWVENDLPAAAGPGSGLCFDFAGGAVGDNCREISLYLEYPFRLVSGTPAAGEFLHVIPLKTIVGRWR